MNISLITSTLGSVCERYGGTCKYDANISQFLLKRNSDTRRELLLVYRSKVFLSFFTSAYNRNTLTASLRKVLTEGDLVLGTGIYVEYDQTSESEGGVIVRFYLTDIKPEDFERRINDVAKCVDVVMEKIDAINAFSI